MDLQSALSWTQETSALSSFSPPAAPPCWGTGASPLLSAWTQPSYPETQGLTALRRESSRQLVTEPNLKAKRPAPAGGGFGAHCGPPEKSGQPRAHTAQRAHPEAALREHSEWKPKPKWSQIAPQPSSKHRKEQSQPVWNAAMKRITFGALLTKWMKLEHMKQGSQLEREKPGL